jgi:DNA ligase-1
MKYLPVAKIYESLENTSKRLEKTKIISDFLKNLSQEEVSYIILLLQGRVFPLWDETNLGVSDKLVMKAISVATGEDSTKISSIWKKIGDLGRVAEELVSKKTQNTLFSDDLTAERVYENIKKMAFLEGMGSTDQKIKLIANLLTSAKPLEARYVVRLVLEDLRVGIGSGTLRDAIVWAFFEDQAKVNYNLETKTIDPENREDYSKLCEKVQHAIDMTSDYGEVIEKIMQKGLLGLKEISLKPGKPIQVMLYPKAKDIEDAFERLGRPCAFEYKMDGFRLQIHKFNDEVKLFTRRLDEVTKQFPEVVKYVKEYIKAESFIIDSEAVGYDPKTGKYLPFQSISQRIRRKYDIEKMSDDFPVEMNLFDIMNLEGQDLLKEPFEKRRALLEKITVQKEKKIVLAKQKITSDEKEAQLFYDEALKAGEEGMMAKSLSGIYKPGSRVGYGMKIKPIMEPLDLVIVGGTWGTGKRSGWITSLNLACKKGDSFVNIGKVGTGLKELESEGFSFEQMTNLLKPHILTEEGKEVEIKPAVIIEVNYEEIQKSPTYESGYALRFPRFIRVREDKPLSEISDIEFIEELYYEQ